MNQIKDIYAHSNPVFKIGFLLTAFWFVIAIIAPYIIPYDPNATIKPYVKVFSSFEGQFFLLGTDNLGRDILSRTIIASRNVIFYATSATILAYMVGITMGLVAGYYRGYVDKIMNFIANLVLSFPVVVLYIIIVTTFEKSTFSIFFAVVFASSPGIYRIVRGLTLDICTRDYIAASETRGERALYLLFVDILPNARGPLVVDFCLRIGYTTIQLGFLAFIGLGLSPQEPDWGQMIANYREEIITNYYMILTPIFALISLVLGLNLLADGLREYSLKD